MSVLDFLFPFIMAADSHAKVKKQKDAGDAIRSLKESRENNERIDKIIEEKYSDVDLEFNSKEMTDKEILNITKTLPSYDKNQEWNINSNDGFGGIDTADFKTRLRLAKHGKLSLRDIRAGAPYSLYSNFGTMWGRTRYDYRGQIKHELMLEWERRLHEAGFPYDLYVIEKIDKAFIVKLARECKYMYGNEYQWSYAPFVASRINK